MSNFQKKLIKEYQSKGYTVLKTIRLNLSGYPDLLCMKLGEIDIWIESKELNDTLKPLQKKRIDELNALGKKAYCMQDTKGIIYPIY
jgi:hypothetical protein